jgi:hypothetical protein
MDRWLPLLSVKRILCSSALALVHWFLDSCPPVPPSPSPSYLDTLALLIAEPFHGPFETRDQREKRGREDPVDRVALSVSP